MRFGGISYLGGIRPRQRSPAELVDRVSQEDHRNGGDARWRSFVVLRRRSSLVDDIDDDEAASHQDAGNVQCRLAVPALGEEQDISPDHDELLGSEETSN